MPDPNPPKASRVVHTPNSPFALTPEAWERVFEETHNQERYRIQRLEQIYLSKEKFPLTTQGNLTLEQQMQIDAMNHGSLEEMQEEGRPMSATQQEIWKELEQKIAMFPALKPDGSRT